MTNVTGLTHYQSQAAGYFSLGSVSRRNQVDRAQIVMAQAPQINADCSGIDMHLGGIGYISAEAFIQLLKNIGSSVKSYAFLLALETVTPMIAGQLKKLQDVVQHINMANLNSCEAAAALINAAVPRSASLKTHTCKLLAGQKGLISYWGAGASTCSERNTQQEKILTDSADKNKDTMLGPVNIAWFVMEKHPEWKKGLKEVVMSMTGTVVINNGGKTTVYAPLALEEDFLDAFTKGGTTEVYKCQDSRCMMISQAKEEIEEEKSHTAQVRNQIISIERKVFKDEPLTAAEKLMIEETQVPILKIINIMSAHHKGSSPITIEMYANLIAQDLLLKHIQNLLTVVEQLIEQLQFMQIDGDQLKQYKQQVYSVQKKIAYRNVENQDRVKQIFEIIDRTSILEKSITSNMRAIVSE